MKKHKVSLATRKAEEVVLTDEQQAEIENTQITEQESITKANKRRIRQDLEATDKQMARVAEDIIDLLMQKGIINQVELPAEALAVLVKRKNLRQNLQ